MMQAQMFKKRPLFGEAIAVILVLLVLLIGLIVFLDVSRTQQQHRAIQSLTSAIDRVNETFDPDVQQPIVGFATRIQPPWWIAGPADVWDKIAGSRWELRRWQWERYRVVSHIDICGDEGTERITGILRYRAFRDCLFVSEVSLDNTDCDDNCVEWLSQMQECYGVGLTNTLITDRAIDHLAKMQNLALLVLDRTAITDASIPALARMQQLDSLSLDGTNISDRGIDELKRLLPNCRIHRQISED